MADAISLAKEGIEAFNKGDWERSRQLSTPDVVYYEAATGTRTQDIDGFVAASKAWRSAFPDATGTVTSSLASGETAVIEVTWEGTQTGDMMAPSGDRIPATGKKVRIPAVQIVRTSGGKIAETRHYFDQMSMMAQLGVMPAGTRA
jgi:steroid delta-isomerase-like uncharacterized protein